MKKILLALLLLAGLSINAQTLTNPNFENWASNTSYYTDTLPSNWWPFNCNTVHQTTDSYQGTYATRIQGWFACGIAPGIMVNGQAPVYYGDIIASGTPFTSKPATISGFYKYTDVTAGDSAEVTIILKKYNNTGMKRDTVAYAVKTLPPSAGYSVFTVNLTDLMPGVSPDSIIIMFNSSKYSLFDMTTMALPSLYIDRIVLPETPTGIEEGVNSLLASGIYPNPFAEQSTLEIEGDLSNYPRLSVHVVDISGKEVMVRAVESNKVLLNRNTLSKGTYIYQVRNDATLVSKGKFIIQ